MYQKPSHSLSCKPSISYHISHHTSALPYVFPMNHRFFCLLQHLSPFSCPRPGPSSLTGLRDVHRGLDEPWESHGIAKSQILWLDLDGLHHVKSHGDLGDLGGTWRFAMEVLHLRNSFEEALQDPHWPDLKTVRQNAANLIPSDPKWLFVTESPDSILQYLLQYMTIYLSTYLSIIHIYIYNSTFFTPSIEKQLDRCALKWPFFPRIRCRPRPILSALAQAWSIDVPNSHWLVD